MIDNPYAGKEIGRIRNGSKISIFYDGRKSLVNAAAAKRLNRLIASTSATSSWMSLAAGAYKEYQFSEEFGTFLGRNGRHAYTKWAEKAGKYAEVIAEAKAASRVAGSLSTAGTAVSLGFASYDYFNSDMGVGNTFMYGAELTVARISSSGSPQGLAVGLGWELGRATTTLPPYQRWRNNTWMPWRLENMGY